MEERGHCRGLDLSGSDAMCREPGQKQGGQTFASRSKHVHLSWCEALKMKPCIAGSRH